VARHSIDGFGLTEAEVPKLVHDDEDENEMEDEEDKDERKPSTSERSQSSA
jgi:hypothetical protein